MGTATADAKRHFGDRMDRVDHIVVIYQENHSFDNLWGRWEGVRGLRSADAAHTRQVKQDGTLFKCLPQDDVNLTAPDPLSDQCQDTNPTDGSTFHSHFFNERRTSNDGNPFQVDTYIPATAKTCPDPSTFGPANGVRDPNGLPGGCTRDLVHRYYQEQYQLDGGKQDRYTTGSDALGLTQGYYGTRRSRSTATCTAGASPLRDLGRVLPVGLRRLVPEPPVADRRTHAFLARGADERARQPPLDHGHQRDAGELSVLQGDRYRRRLVVDRELPVHPGAARQPAPQPGPREQRVRRLGG